MRNHSADGEIRSAGIGYWVPRPERRPPSVGHMLTIKLPMLARSLTPASLLQLCRERICSDAGG
jgi:hypothetical protein